MGVVIVVPSFTATEECHPPAVAGMVAGFEAARSPHVSRRVDEPGGMQTEGDAQEDSPHEAGPAADGEQDQADNDHGNPVVFADPDVELIAGKIGSVAGEHGSLIM